MSKFTADEVEKEAKIASECGDTKDAAMLRELARRLRQEEEENRRDPVTEPRMGDQMIMPCGWKWVFVPCQGMFNACAEYLWREEINRFPGATIIRRREVQP